MPFSFISSALAVAQGVKGLFGSKPKEKTPRDNMLSQAAGAREAAEQYGFNPLTMLQYGQPGGAISGGGGPAPLASMQILQDGLRGFDDIQSGDLARRRALDEHQVELARIQLDEVRRGVGLNRASDIGPSPAVFGRQAVPVAQPNLRRAGSEAVGGDLTNPLDPTRKIERDPIVNMPGFFEVQNRLTYGKPIVLPGEELENDPGSLTAVAAIGGPQVVVNAARFHGERFRAENKEARESEENRKRVNQRRRDRWSVSPFRLRGGVTGFLGSPTVVWDNFRNKRVH